VGDARPDNRRAGTLAAGGHLARAGNRNKMGRCALCRLYLPRDPRCTPTDGLGGVERAGPVPRGHIAGCGERRDLFHHLRPRLLLSDRSYDARCAPPLPASPERKSREKKKRKNTTSHSVFTTYRLFDLRQNKSSKAPVRPRALISNTRYSATPNIQQHRYGHYHQSQHINEPPELKTSPRQFKGESQTLPSTYTSIWPLAK